MASWWRGFALAGMLIAGFVGCSGKSDHNGDDDSGAQAGSNGAGHAGSGGGAGGTGAKGGTNGGGTGGTRSGGTGGMIASEGGAAGTEEGGGRGGMLAAGRAAVGGTAGTVAGSGNDAGRGGTAGSGTAGSGGSVPLGWFCALAAYGDGTCDCGCGIRDSDCKKTDIDHCERCNASGSCAGTNAVCPGRIDAMDTTKCIQSPSTWYCSNSLYSDGKVCNCGCGAPDPDCKDDTLDSCDSCSDSGSCAHDKCPSSIDPSDNSTCYVPPEWTCGDFNYGDQFCDCGCGAPDPKCKDQTDASCDFCTGLSCTGGYDCAGRIDPTNNTVCTVPPPQWKCASRLYHDGSSCDCGCGAPDPDCGSLDATACDHCDADGSCSGLDCPGIIDPNNNAACMRPDHPPTGWTCSEYMYGDGYSCDCGCGVIDADCHGTELQACNSCVNCSAAQDCLNSVLATDISQCRPAPDGWTCKPAQFHDGYCECGCGILDPDCPSKQTAVCSICPAEGCAAGKCSHLSADDNTTCSIVAPSTWKCDRAYYGDLTCDCGCGAPDPDCKSAKASDCSICDDPGSCSAVTCKSSDSTINPTDNTTCTN